LTIEAGMRALRTEPLGLAEALCAAEALPPGDLRRFPHRGDLVGAAVVTSGFAPLPLAAFDSLGPKLGACEQAAYFQLLRLSYGEGRNFCRVSKRDLQSRLGLPERRLNRVLDALSRQGALRPLHRDNRGTLYRVCLPAEIEGRPPEGVVLGAPSEPESRPIQNKSPVNPAGKAGTVR
jgi:hypothetical protein